MAGSLVIDFAFNLNHLRDFFFTNLLRCQTARVEVAAPGSIYRAGDFSAGTKKPVRDLRLQRSRPSVPNPLDHIDDGLVFFKETKRVQPESRTLMILDE
jgi:hypothetical protein